jgi:hypothetical protein
LAQNDWIMPVLLTGGLAIGGIMLLPTIMKSVKGNRYEDEEDYIPLSRAEEAAKEAARVAAEEAFEQGRKLPLVDIPDIYGIGRGDDDAYLITDEDFRKLDIGKKDRRWLNRERKLKDARMERVLYGDSARPSFIPFAGNVNTVSPYGLAPSPEFVRLSGAEGLSRSNTRGNTLNLY